MKRRSVVAVGLLATGLTVFGCSDRPGARTEAGWITLFDGSNLDHWNRTGSANWTVADGVVQADKGDGYLVSKDSYSDFELRVEFWVDAAANSGVFLRVADPQNITPANSYEVNIFDNRPDPDYGTGAIVNFAKVAPMPKAAGKWNTYEIRAEGPRLTVTLNGARTVDIQDSTLKRGPVALQYASGVVKFRKVQVRPL